MRGAENMALDEALMHRAGATGEWILRVYSWSAPTMSLGRNQSARGRYDLDRLANDGIDVVRRPTGGRAILHHREITYSVTAPVDGAGDLRTSYHRINDLLLHALERLGVRASLASSAQRTAAPNDTPCFDRPSSGEVMVGGAKLAGSAQWRSADALLQHGSILVADDQTRLGRYLTGDVPPIPAPATLSTLLGRTPSIDDLADALAGAVRTLEDPRASTLELDPEVRARASALVVRYRDDAWTWRR
jgi:lipoate-protein ligase A